MTHILHSPLSSTSCLHCTVYNKQALPTLCLIFRPQPLSTATCLPSNAPHAETPTHGLNFRHSLWTPVFKKKRLTWQRNLTKKLNSYATLRALTCNIRYLAAIHLTYLSRWVCMAITHISTTAENGGHWKSISCQGRVAITESLKPWIRVLFLRDVSYRLKQILNSISH